MSVEQDNNEGTRERLINNSITLPSPLRSSAGSRRACRKRDSRGGGAREESRRQNREERGERREKRLEHEKP